MIFLIRPPEESAALLWWMTGPNELLSPCCLLLSLLQLLLQRSSTPFILECSRSSSVGGACVDQALWWCIAPNLVLETSTIHILAGPQTHALSFLLRDEVDRLENSRQAALESTRASSELLFCDWSVQSRSGGPGPTNDPPNFCYRFLFCPKVGGQASQKQGNHRHNAPRQRPLQRTLPCIPDTQG